MEYILSMTFITDTGKKTSFSVDGVKPTITKDEITALMDTIIEKNVFLSSKGAIVQKSGANITQRTVTSYEF